MNDIIKNDDGGYQIMETVIAKGDLSKLTPKQRVEYYHAVCKSVGLNPLTRPFDYISFDGKVTLYARKDCSEQLRNNHKISIYKLEKETMEGVYVVTAYARKANGQEDIATGACTIKGLQGKALANAFKISETQAKRRVTLSICGLGWTDESEIDDVPNAKKIPVDFDTGEIQVEPAQPLISQLPPKEISIEAMKMARTLEELQMVFNHARNTYRQDKAVLAEIIAVKDMCKQKIQDEIPYELDENDRAEANAIGG